MAKSRTKKSSLAEWRALEPELSGKFKRDAAAHSSFWQGGGRLLAMLPAKSGRSAPEQDVARQILERCREARVRFLAMHGTALYRKLTRNLKRHERVEALAYAAADAVPGLVPSRETVAAEMQSLQKDKDGHELDQGLLFNAFLADRECGLHLCHSMLRPRAEALDLLHQYRADGRADLGGAMVERLGVTAVVWMKNSRFLNAEDESTLASVEIAVDLAMLDPDCSICVLRGAPIESGKYAGRNVFCTGINLTHLYQGQISYLWYLIRDLGFINKIYRGLAGDRSPDEVSGDTLEKPWVAAVENFAIGGGCQYLLVMDYVLAADDAYMTLPARKEGIIPGVANMRLPRFVGDRIARQAVMYDRRIDCDSPEGRLICDEVVSPRNVDTALAEVTSRLTSSGVVSVAGNRRAFRVVQEPLDMFRSYMAVYAREQAYCHFSPALIDNLEQFWNAAQRAA